MTNGGLFGDKATNGNLLAEITRLNYGTLANRHCNILGVQYKHCNSEAGERTRKWLSRLLCGALHKQSQTRKCHYHRRVVFGVARLF